MYLPAWQGLTWRELWGPVTKRPIPFPLDHHETVTAFHTARSAIYHLFRELVRGGRRIVLMPDYHMGNEVRAIRAAGAHIIWYPITRRFSIDMGGLRLLCRQHRPDVLFVIHYGGWPQPVEELKRLSEEHDLVLVEDCAMALFSEIGGYSVGTFGHYSIFCLYKTLPLPNGGLLVENRPVVERLTALSLHRPGPIFVAGRVAELALERFRSRHPALGRRLMAGKLTTGRLLNAMGVKRVGVGDIGFNADHANIGMAALSRAIANRCDPHFVKQRRRENFLALRSVCPRSAVAQFELPPGTCPLFFPLLVSNKSEAAEGLRRRGVMATELWNEGDDSVLMHEGPDSQFLRHHVLELPIHQDIMPAHIEYMGQQLRELQLPPPPGAEMTPATGAAASSAIPF